MSEIGMTDNAPVIDLKNLLAGAQLPALPQSAIRLIELSQDPENGPAEFALPIEGDAGLAGQVLRFVNSSYFGFSGEISSVKQAITLVGVRTIKNFALWSAVFNLMPNPKSGPIDLKGLWQDSLRRGLLSRAMGKIMGIRDPEDLFAAALLQDVAIPLLARELPSEYLELLLRRQDGQKRLSELELERFGWTHAHAGGVITRAWRLPKQSVDLIETHTRLDQSLAEQPADPAKLAVGLSATLPSTCDLLWYEAEQFDAAYCQLRGDGPAVAELLTQIDDELGEFAPVLELTAPGKSLVEYYQEASAVGANQ